MKRLTLRLTDFLLFLCPFLIFYPSFRYFFFQDDFLHLKTSLIQDFSGFLSFFRVPEDAIFYRPLSLQIYFFTTRSLFGLNPLAFRFISFLFFLLSVFLLKRLIKKITGDDLLSFAVAFLFGISSIHFISLFWICEFSVILGVFFLLLSFFYYPKRRALFFFILGFLSHELVMILPFLLTFYELVFKKNSFKNLVPFFVLSFFYFIARFLIFPIPLEGTYKLTFGKKNLSALAWYFLWSFNLPEELKYQSVLSKLQIRIEFIRNFLNNFIIWSAGFLLILLFLIVLPLMRKKIYFNKKTKETLSFGFAWFLIGVFPLIFAPFHQYPMYGSFALPGLYLALMTWFFASLKKEIDKIILALLLTYFLLLSLTTVRFTEKTHWTVQEARKAKKMLEKVSAVSGKTVFILPRDPQLKAALNDQDAFQVFYQDEVRVFYGEEKDLKYNQDFKKVVRLDED